jgi:hypothetical protein
MGGVLASWAGQSVEVKALLSGVTTIQGTSPGSQCIRTLIRNAENQANLPVPASHTRTYILDISSFQGGIDLECDQELRRQGIFDSL